MQMAQMLSLLAQHDFTILYKRIVHFLHSFSPSESVFLNNTIAKILTIGYCDKIKFRIVWEDFEIEYIWGTGI